MLIRRSGTDWLGSNERVFKPSSYSHLELVRLHLKRKKQLQMHLKMLDKGKILPDKQIIQIISSY